MEGKSVLPDNKTDYAIIINTVRYALQDGQTNRTEKSPDREPHL